MENEILKDIIEYAKSRLTSAYGYCGVAEGAEMAMLNSDDKRGNDIKINIKITDED